MTFLIQNKFGSPLSDINKLNFTIIIDWEIYCTVNEAKVQHPKFILYQKLEGNCEIEDQNRGIEEHGLLTFQGRVDLKIQLSR